MNKLLLLLTLYFSIYSSPEDKLEIFTHCMQHIEKKINKWYQLAQNIGYDRKNFLKIFPYNKLFHMNKENKITIRTKKAKTLFNKGNLEDFLILKNDFRINNLLSNKDFFIFLEHSLDKLAIIYESYIETEEKFKKYFYSEARKVAKRFFIKDKEVIYNLLIKKIITILEKKKRKKQAHNLTSPIAVIMQKDFVVPEIRLLIKELINKHNDKDIESISLFSDSKIKFVEKIFLDPVQWHSLAWKGFSLNEIYEYYQYKLSAQEKLNLIKHYYSNN